MNDAPHLSRRRLLTGGATTIGGAALGGAAVAGALGTDRAPATASDQIGSATEPFHGEHQAGIATAPQAHAAFIAFDLKGGVDRAALVRLMALLTDDAARLTQGRAPLADTEPELAYRPARLTVTLGFGPNLFTAAGLADRCPIGALPPFTLDRLIDRWSGGDLLIQVCADDPLTLTHAQRMLVKDTRAFATVRWIQRGFQRTGGTHGDGRTPRNVLGQIDGTGNPAPGSPAFRAAVWNSAGPAWLSGGTTLVVRRIQVNLETWDAADRTAREFTIGRRLDNGAPLTGRVETDRPDFTATNQIGFPVISEFAHIRRAFVEDDRLRIFRRPYNFDDGLGADGRPDAGLIFAAYQADAARQFTPIQRKLDEADLLNAWVTPIGSAVFAIPPGCPPGGYLGQTLLG